MSKKTGIKPKNQTGQPFGKFAEEVGLLSSQFFAERVAGTNLQGFETKKRMVTT
jgi:hypothetical protein